MQPPQELTPSRPSPNGQNGSATDAAATSARRFVAIASDYDGTLAEDGIVSRDTLAALHEAKASGLKLLLVTGRELDDLMRVFPEVGVFDLVVAENGALLYTPPAFEGAIPRERPLAQPPPPEFAETLIRRGVQPLSCGRIIVATWEPHEQAVLETIRELGLELEVIFNKGAVMVLPSGINKASGLKVAAEELGIAVERIVGVGDAENDHSLLNACGLGVAVANAVPALKRHADLVTDEHRGRGVVELLRRMQADDLAGVRRNAPISVVHTVAAR